MVVDVVKIGGSSRTVRIQNQYDEHMNKTFKIVKETSVARNYQLFCEWSLFMQLPHAPIK